MINAMGKKLSKVRRWTCTGLGLLLYIQWLGKACLIQRHLRKHLKEGRKEAIYLPRGKTFQAEETGGPKALEPGSHNQGKARTPMWLKLGRVEGEKTK